MAALRERIEDTKEELSTFTERVEFRQGYIQACRDISNFRMEDSE